VSEVGSAKNIGIIGLGAMGHQLARRIAGGEKTVYGYDVNPALRDDLLAHGVVACESVVELATRSDICLLSLPDDKAVAQVVAQIKGASNLPHLIIDCTTSLPSLSQQLAAELKALGTSFVDAPLSGGVGGAQAGRLTAMVGGDESAISTARGILQNFSASVVVIGDSGAGHLCKLINNGLSSLALAATAEILAFSNACGCDALQLLENINLSLGASNASQDKFPKYIMSEKYDFGFALKLMLKDLTLLSQVLATSKCAAPVNALVRELLAIANNTLAPQSDLTRYAEMVNSWGHPSISHLGEESDQMLTFLTDVLAGLLVVGTSELLASIDHYRVSQESLLSAINRGSGRNEITRARGGERDVTEKAVLKRASTSWRSITQKRRDIDAPTPLLSCALGIIESHNV